MNPTIPNEIAANRVPKEYLPVRFLLDDQLGLALAMGDYAAHLLFESKDEIDTRAAYALKVAMENLEIAVKKYTEFADQAIENRQP